MISPRLNRIFAIVLIAILGGCSTIAPETQAVGRSAIHVPVDMLNTDVTRETIDKTICTPDYTATVRPGTSYTNAIKLKLIGEAGLAPSEAGRYELDHVIPLALGGHPRSIHNLALQHWDGDDGAKRKDRLERMLQRMVCARRIDLVNAQETIYTDWRAAYRRYVAGRE